MLIHLKIPNIPQSLPCSTKSHLDSSSGKALVTQILYGGAKYDHQILYKRSKSGGWCCTALMKAVHLYESENSLVYREFQDSQDCIV